MPNSISSPWVLEMIELLELESTGKLSMRVSQEQILARPPGTSQTRYKIRSPHLRKGAPRGRTWTLEGAKLLTMLCETESLFPTPLFFLFFSRSPHQNIYIHINLKISSRLKSLSFLRNIWRLIINDARAGCLVAGARATGSP